MTRTDEFFDLTVNLEGGFSNRADDKGGKTKYGVTQITLNLYNVKHSIPAEDVANLTVDKAKDIYTEFYYLTVKPIADKEIHFNCIDICYNSGHGNYLKMRESIEDNLTLENIYKWREDFYTKLNQPSNIKGWLNRLQRIKNYFHSESTS